MKMDLIQENNKVLLLWDQTFDPTSINIEEILENKKATIGFENVERLELGKCYKFYVRKMNKACEIKFIGSKFAASYNQSTFDLIISKTKEIGTNEHLVALLKYLKPKGRLVFSTTNESQISESITETLKLNGFVNINVTNNGEF